MQKQNCWIYSIMKGIMIILLTLQFLKNGSRISEIKLATFTRIDLGRPETPEDGSEQQIANVVIHGTKSDICNAQEQILNIVKELENQITTIIHIDPQHHKY